MSEVVWKFRPKDKSEKNVGFTLGEFFTSKELEFPGKALVREVVQNSLDARLENEKPVVVRFSLLTGNHSISSSAFMPFLNGLDEHFNVVRPFIKEIPATTSSMPVLLIEDFNTRGLDGDPSDYQEQIICEKPENKNFFYFWRNWGISSKSDKDRGRWGLGKVVYPKSSKARTFFGLTIRNDDKKHYLMGQTVIRQHTIRGITYDLFGDYGLFADDNEYFVMPVEEPAFLEKFRSVFSITRKDESGLSIIIPYTKEEITANNLMLAFVSQFFYPIISGMLIAEICENDKKTIIDENTISSVLDKINFDNPLIARERITKEKLEHLLSFTVLSLGVSEKEVTRLNHYDIAKKPDWKKIIIDEKTLENLITKFENQEIISFEVSVRVELKGGSPEKGFFRVFIQKDEELLNPEYYFIREGLIIGKAGTFSARGVRAMVIIDSAPLTNLLGDAENPSHMDWRQNSDKFQDKYEYGPAILTFIKYCLNELFGRLNQKKAIMEPDLLVEIFSIAKEEPEEEKKEKATKKRGKDVTKKKKIVITRRRPALVNINKIAGGGVRISDNPENPDKPEVLILEFAYDIERGDPFSKYSPWDFDLSDDSMKIESRGIWNITRNDQTMQFEIADKDFEISVSGFDPHRDIKVSVEKEAVHAQ